MYYTHITRSVHTPHTRLTCKYKKMCVITHTVDVILRVKLLAVVQLELIKCM